MIVDEMLTVLYRPSLVTMLVFMKKHIHQKTTCEGGNVCWKMCNDENTITFLSIFLFNFQKTVCIS